MSKVLVDRELLEQIVNTNMADYAVIAYQHKEIRSILAQPAEAEGVDFGFDDRSVKVSQEAYSIFLERERHHLAALSSVTAERDRLQQFEAAYNEWHDKTEWVQKTAKANELGKHRADVLKERVDKIQAEVEALRKDAERYRWASSGVHEAETLVSIVNCHGGYAEKVAERVDVYREAAMAAKEPEPEHVCSGCGAKGWTGNCLECIPY